ncbi:MAG: site-2 protease family protein [Clostridia bacterium]|nr:site-2 protease family protein [Clostridia bacterium]
MKFIPLISAAEIWGKAWPVLVAILFFGLLIFFHELGHFTFAKLFKVKVHEFAMGMGPTLLKFKKGETKYALRLFPIGGFVSMEGEDEDSDDEGAFCNKPAWQRFIIVAAGGTINLIMGVIIVAIMLSQSSLIGLPEIHSFEENAVSSQHLQAGDKIEKINGKRVYSEYDLSFLMMRDKDGIIDFTVEREGEKVELPQVPFQTYDNNGVNTIVYDFIIRGVEPGVWSVAKNSVLQSVSIGRIVWISLLDLVTGQYGLSDLSGPIGTVTYIADAAQTATQKTDYTYLFNLMAMIAINIGLFNLLPLPALDGGRLLFIAIEVVFRKKVPAKFEGWVHAVGIVLLLGLMVIVSFSDIMKLIRG